MRFVHFFLFLFFFFVLFFWNKGSLCIPGWPWTQRHPSASWILCLKVWTTMSSCMWFYNLFSAAFNFPCQYWLGGCGWVNMESLCNQGWPWTAPECWHCRQQVLLLPVVLLIHGMWAQYQLGYISSPMWFCVTSLLLCVNAAAGAD